MAAKLMPITAFDRLPEDIRVELVQWALIKGPAWQGMQILEHHGYKTEFRFLQTWAARQRPGNMTDADYRDLQYLPVEERCCIILANKIEGWICDLPSVRTKKTIEEMGALVLALQRTVQTWSSIGRMSADKEKSAAVQRRSLMKAKEQLQEEIRKEMADHPELFVQIKERIEEAAAIAEATIEETIAENGEPLQ